MVICETCGSEMDRKINVDDILLHWCPSCGTCRLVAPDLEDFQTWWRPLREGLVRVRRQSSREGA